MNVNDLIEMSPMWKYDKASGRIIKITKDGYIIVQWDEVPGDWYFTYEQISKAKLIKSKG
mgnify:FL=1